MEVPTSASLYGVWGSGSSDVFAVGSGGTLLRYDGISWMTLNSTTNLQLNAVWGQDRIAFVVGQDPAIYRHIGPPPARLQRCLSF
ncbi:hypothetical protein WME79_19090 [Sorangium sp. So ce726]|uniref:hypothetical protein n=1 Tax=Sorangium sp. So ce726 TaxID=3133319 RepID=UPI003F61AA76